MLDLVRSIPFCESLTWKDCGPYAIAIVAGVSILVTYFSTKRWNFYRYLADRHFEILQLGVSTPKFMDPHQTRRYNEVWPIGCSERNAYEAYARLCWSHARDIYSVRLFLFHGYFRKNYANTLETYRRLHGIWLKNNSSVFPDNEFLLFVERCAWREYFDARTADLLRWNNEVEEYDEKILHPMLVEKENPLLTYIENLPRDKKLVVADVGCGNGSFVAKLASNARFEKIYGIDYSDNMVEIAKNRCKGIGNVEIIKMDMKDLTTFYGKLDMVFSINSILPRDPRDTEPMLAQIAKTLKPNGKLIAILPSFDTVEYLKKLEFKNFRESQCYLRAWLSTRKLFYGERKMNKRKKLYADDGVNIQRFIHKEEIKPLLAKARLTLSQPLEKLCYPWELASRYKYGYFQKEEPIWDWFVVAWRGNNQSNS